MNKIIVGNILNTHGIKGTLKIRKTNSESFNRNINYYIGENYIPVKIKNAREAGDLVYLDFYEFDNINQVLSFKGEKIYIDEENLPILEKDEYYVKDLIGSSIYNYDEEIGILEDVLTYSANDVYIVKGKNKKILIPVVKEFVKEVDIFNKKIFVQLIEGFLNED